MPKDNPYLLLPSEINDSLQKLLQKPDFKVLDESRLTRYQHDFKELQVLSISFAIVFRFWEKVTFPQSLYVNIVLMDVTMQSNRFL